MITWAFVPPKPNELDARKASPGVCAEAMIARARSSVRLERRGPGRQGGGNFQPAALQGDVSVQSFEVQVSWNLAPPQSEDHFYQSRDAGCRFQVT